MNSYVLRRLQSAVNWGLAYLDLEVSRHSGIGKHLMLDVRRLCPDPKVIFDVGANIGQTYSAYRLAYPKASILSFEPSLDAFGQLEDRMRGDSRATAIPFALGNISEISEFTEFVHSTANSLLRPKISAVTPEWVKATSTSSHPNYD